MKVAGHFVLCITEQLLKRKWYNFATKILQAFLSAQASSLSAFVISKTRIVAQKPQGRQLTAKADIPASLCHKGITQSILVLWNLSAMDTSGTKTFVLISEVSLFRGICIYINLLCPRICSHVSCPGWRNG